MSSQAHLSPNSVKIESAVLGAALLEANSLRTVLSILTTAEVFYLEKHQLIFGAILKLTEQQQAVDNLTVVQYLRGTGTLNKVGGPHYVASLQPGNSVHVETHCRILQQQYARRVIIKAGVRFQDYGYDEGLDPLELVSSVQVELTRMQQSMETRRATTAAALLPDVLDSIRRAVGITA